MSFVSYGRLPGRRPFFCPFENMMGKKIMIPFLSDTEYNGRQVTCRAGRPNIWEDETMVKEILKLGDPRLYQTSQPVSPEEGEALKGWVADLHDTLMEYRRVHGAGRAVAAPQIGVFKRLLYMYLDKPYVFVNPTLTFPDEEKYVLMDDCMSFPGLCVRVERYRRAVIRYQDMDFQDQVMELEGDLSELLQHEYDHLDGVLATMRAVDNKSFFFMEMKRDFSSNS